ncbi:MAG TPA: hypothetical protein VFC78_09955 [Tepidisphaeraceae bacterium]|nr:hypothetical protein [Tepidisphaeraceae bacterium]
MKPAVAIVLIIGGIVLVALPPLSDAWHASMIMRVMEASHNQNQSVMLPGTMEDAYRFGCWLVGALMVLVAVVASIVPPMLQYRRFSASGPPT